MCRFCQGEELNRNPQVVINLDGGTLEINYSAYSTDSSFSEEIEISFCPICGSNLKEVRKVVLKERAEQEAKERRLEDKKRRRQQINDIKNHFANMKIGGNVYKVDGVEVCSISKKCVKRDFAGGEIEVYILGGRLFSEIKKEREQIEKENRIEATKKRVLDKLFENDSIEVYKENIKKEIGSDCTCPSCFENFKKESYQQVFCKSKGGTVCKDKFWNYNKGKIKKYPKF